MTKTIDIMQTYVYNIKGGDEVKMWDKHEVAKAWEISPAFAMLKMRKMACAELKVDGGKAKWFIPAGTEKPGRKRRGDKKG